MTIKQIKTLAASSYTKDSLDAKKVSSIAKLLTRAQLKTYVKFLRSLKRSKTVKVIMPKLDAKSDLVKNLRKIFPDKKMEFSEDKSLIAGLKIIDNDNIYDFNLKNTFENLVSYINQ
jgi:F0F1-type ATP synthase delta subunit